MRYTFQTFLKLYSIPQALTRIHEHLFPFVLVPKEVALYVKDAAKECTITASMIERDCIT